MANIPLLDIPATPNYDPSMPMAQGRVPDLPRLRGIQGELQAPNIAKHIKGLQQPGIDPGIVRETYRANMALAGSLQNLGEQTMQLAGELQRSKDVSDISRASNLVQNEWELFSQQADKEMWTPAQRQAEWNERAAPDGPIATQINSLGMSSFARSEALPKVNLFMNRKASELSHQTTVFTIENDKAEIRLDMENRLTQGDRLGAKEANRRMTLGGHQSEAVEKQMDQVIDVKGDVYDFQVQLNQDVREGTRVALSEAEEMMAFGSSDVYSHIKDPKMIADLHNQARAAIDHMQVDVKNQASNLIYEKKLTNMEEVKQFSHGRLDATDLAAVEKQLLANPSFNAETIATLRTEAMGYDYNNDPDLAKHRALHTRITTEVPEAEAKVLLQELEKNIDDGRNGRPKPLADRIGAHIRTEVNELATGGVFDNPDKPYRDPSHRSIITDHEEHNRVFGVAEAINERMYQWLQGHKDAGMEDIMVQLKKELSPYTDKKAAGAFEKMFQGLRETLQGTGKTTAPLFPAMKPFMPAEKKPVRAPLSPQQIEEKLQGGAPLTTPDIGGKLQGKPTSGVNPELINRVKGLAATFGPLEINSGYRSPEHNRAVGGARGSQHTRGNAVDVSVKGMSLAERVNLIRAASKAGITGIGVYSTALHFDMGPRRAWGPSYHRPSVPRWAEDAIQEHENA